MYITEFDTYFAAHCVAPFARIRWTAFERFVETHSKMFPHPLPLRGAIVHLLPTVDGVALISKLECDRLLRHVTTGSRDVLWRCLARLGLNKLNARDFSATYTEMAYYAKFVDPQRSKV